MRSSRVWAQLPGCENTVIEDVDWQEDSGGLRLVVHVRPYPPRRCCALTRSTSWAGPPGPSMRSAAGSGGPPARSPAPSRTCRPAAGSLRLSAGGARDLRRARYALWKNPENLSDRQQAKLAWSEKTHPLLYRAYLLKEGLCDLRGWCYGCAARPGLPSS